ncbi:MAG: hypothetical protein M3428_04440 [Pseudomonadota bacterium]|nr:hypothetical protein [Pseudomonadota bacterium]
MLTLELPLGLKTTVLAVLDLDPLLPLELPLSLETILVAVLDLGTPLLLELPLRLDTLGVTLLDLIPALEPPILGTHDALGTSLALDPLALDTLRTDALNRFRAALDGAVLDAGLGTGAGLHCCGLALDPDLLARLRPLGADFRAGLHPRPLGLNLCTGLHPRPLGADFGTSLRPVGADALAPLGGSRLRLGASDSLVAALLLGLLLAGAALTGVHGLSRRGDRESGDGGNQKTLGHVKTSAVWNGGSR